MLWARFFDWIRCYTARFSFVGFFGAMARSDTMDFLNVVARFSWLGFL
jgi:hypothetical protein